MAAPHTRGSTHAQTTRAQVEAGCPAHAGIDPPFARHSRTQARLPRTRGDRPSNAAELLGSVAAAPHTRGSTLRAIFRSLVRFGCPAHAGIDPGSCWLSARSSRLPRTRGDRPRSVSRTPTSDPAAPHTRGSTPRFAVVARDEGGCPAHAGIDPLYDFRVSALIRLPRTRGDRPGEGVVTRYSISAAPHTRGSTRAKGLEPDGVVGCPPR